MSASLTARQTQVLAFLRAHQKEHGKPPTLKEIGDALAIRSTNGVHKLLVALEKKGHLRRIPHESRGLVLLGDDDAFGFGDERAGAVLFLRRIDAAQAHEAGPPLRRSATPLAVDPDLLGRVDPDDCFALRAADDGMSGDGLFKGDVVVVEELAWSALPNGALVAVLLGERPVVRRFDFANGRVHLRPANRTYAEHAFAPDDPEAYVLGAVRVVMRRIA